MELESGPLGFGRTNGSTRYSVPERVRFIVDWYGVVRRDPVGEEISTCAYGPFPNLRLRRKKKAANDPMRSPKTTPPIEAPARAPADISEPALPIHELSPSPECNGPYDQRFPAESATLMKNGEAHVRETVHVIAEADSEVMFKGRWDEGATVKV